jgi:GT2 family glycosyltransferase
MAAVPRHRGVNGFLVSWLRTLPRRPRAALGALYWQVRGKRKRARNRLRMAVQQLPGAYRQWIITREGREAAIAAAPAKIAGWPIRPRISVLLRLTAEALPALDRQIAALRAQCYMDWELVVTPAPGCTWPPALTAPELVLLPETTAAQALGAMIAAASGEFLFPLAPATLLAPTALLHAVAALQQAPDADLLYGDEDRMDADGRRHTPWFKPRWNEELFLAQDYLSGTALLRRDPAHAALPLGADAESALLLAVAARPGAKVVHVPHVLVHRLAEPTQPSRLASVAAHVAAQGGTARLDTRGMIAIDWPLPEPPPTVSIIIPTRDNPALLRACVESVLAKTTYPAFEVLIVDNGSVAPAALAALADLAGRDLVRLLRYDAPFNYAAINNFAARHSDSRFLCLLNDDTEVIAGDWLTELVRQGGRPHVGAVGARLLYEDGSLQHGGVVIGLGDAAGHAHRFLKPGEDGYFLRTHLAHTVSAVTGACLLVERAKYTAVGGLDEQNFAIAFNDVDFCLRLQAAGWRNVYAPRAVLTHHESKSRGSDMAPSQLARFRRELAALQTRWGTAGYVDPLHHPNLDRVSETYVLRL